MKKTYVKVLIVLLAIVCAVCLLRAIASATDEIPTSVETEVPEIENMPIVEEIVTEGEISATEEITTEDPVLTTEAIKAWIEENFEEIVAIVTAICTLIVTIRKLTAVIKSIVTCNNNTVDVAEDSKAAINDALSQVATVSAVVGEYKEMIVTLLAEIRQSDDEKKKLEAALTDVEGYLKTAKLANVEFANELAELLVLANIPNAKKEELYARHRAAVDAIDAADHIKTEVNEDVGEEA